MHTSKYTYFSRVWVYVYVSDLSMHVCVCVYIYIYIYIYAHAHAHIYLTCVGRLVQARACYEPLTQHCAHMRCPKASPAVSIAPFPPHL